MPANRSRTERWKDCLAEIAERGGGIEISIAHPGNSDVVDHRNDLVWRVRLFGVSEAELLIEGPSALNAAVRLPTGTELIGAMTIGQNRWMFRTRVLGPQPSLARGAIGVRVTMPDHVERCSRRSFYRVPLGGIELPVVDIWPLLDAESAVAAEVANRAQVHEIQALGRAGMMSPDMTVMPEVGPQFTGRLANVGGGGAGLLVERAEAGPLDHHRLLWLRIDLRPEVEAPIGMTAKLAHTHADSSGRIYAGVAFEFGFNQGHRDFVSEQLARYVAARACAANRAA